VKAILAAVVSLSLAAFPTVAFAAEPAPRFARFSDEQGLSQSTVQAIVQDHVGFLWFGTEEGLNRFDGYAFIVYKHQPADPASLPDDVVSALYEDRQQRLWVGTQRGLSRYDRATDTFERLEGIRDRVTAIAEARDGTLWFGTDGGLVKRDAATGALVAFRHRAGEEGTLGSDHVSAVLIDRRGRLVVGLHDAGVDRLQEEGFVHFRHDARLANSLGHDEVWGLAEDGQGTLWVATYGGGLSALDAETGAWTRHQHRPGDRDSLRTDLATCLFVDRVGTLWAGGAGAGLQRRDPDSGRFEAFVHDPGNSSSLSQDVVRAIYEDAQGQLWVGTYLGGVNLLRKPRRVFRYFQSDPQDPTTLSEIPSSFFEDRQGQVWIGTGDGWLNRFERDGTFTKYPLPPSVPGGAAILSLVDDARGRLWAGTYRTGLGRFDTARKALTLYRHRDGDSRTPSSDEMWALARSGDGHLWLGTNDGLDVFDPEKGIVIAHYGAGPRGLTNASVRAVLCDRRGDVWVGTLAGLNRLTSGTNEVVQYRHRDGDPRSLAHDTVVALHEDLKGRLWAGTLGGGLVLVDRTTGTFTSFRDLPSRVVYRIEEEEPSGRLWLSTNRGLSRFDPQTARADNFDLTNGLQGLQFRIGASLATRDGAMLFGDVDGFYAFKPRDVVPDLFAPPVVLTSLRLFNEPVSAGRFRAAGELLLSHRDRVVTLEFAALDYTFPRRNQYAYVMEGFSNDWISLGTKRDVTFTDLRPGRYLFRVKASNSDGVWSEASSLAVRVTVAPPFWATWWFRAVGVAVVALALGGLHRRRVRHLTGALDERRRTEAALRQAEEKYRGIFENALEGLFQITTTGRFLTVNTALARMLGYASPAEVQVDGSDLVPHLRAGAARARELLERVAVEGVVQSFECEMRRRGGDSVWVSLNLRAVRDEAGALLRYEGTAEDISAHRQARQLQESLRRSEQMAAVGAVVVGVAHEVRNPLFAISANLDTLEVRTRDAPEPAFGLMQREVRRLTDLMQDLLDYGKPVVWSPAPGSIAAVLREALESCALQAKQSDVRLEMSAAADLPPVVMDDKRLLQVFQNLLQHAIQHSPRGGAVRVRAWAAEPGNVVVTVADTGPGFPADDIPRVFEPFFSRRRAGTGLGLAIVQRIVQEHGATIVASNRGEGGALMTVRFPLADK
jgi:PAS domain S-box-containing protein